MTQYIVSSHGGRYTGEKPVTVPANCTVHFYVGDGEVLDNSDAWPLYRALRRGESTTQRIVETFEPGSRMPHYGCWFDDNYEKDCGIFEGGKGGRRVVSLHRYSGQGDSFLRFRDLMKQLPPSKESICIHWVACRTRSTR